MATQRERLIRLRKALIANLEAVARAGQQLASLDAVAVDAQQVWNAQAAALLQAFSSDTTQKIFREKAWRAPVSTLQDRVRQVATDAAAMMHAVTALRGEDAEFAHKLACGEVEQILLTFEAIVRRLAKRRGERSPFVIDNEYDVQYLLQALLAIHFRDVRAEEGVPSHIGANSRIDFFLGEEQIAIEVKATRDGLDDHQLGNQLLEDVARYKKHTDVKTLYFFIWDPAHHIRNAAGIRNDVKRDAGDRAIHVIFSPPRR